MYRTQCIGVCFCGGHLSLQRGSELRADVTVISYGLRFKGRAPAHRDISREDDKNSGRRFWYTNGVFYVLVPHVYGGHMRYHMVSVGSGIRNPDASSRKLN